MAHERLRNAALLHAVSDVVADLVDLFQKEMRLARTELTENLARKVNGGIWMSGAGLLGLIALIFIAQATVFGVASYGIALHWSCLIVAGILALLAAFCYLRGRLDGRHELTPTRTLHHIKRDLTIAKEQLP